MTFTRLKTEATIGATACAVAWAQNLLRDGTIIFILDDNGDELSPAREKAALRDEIAPLLNSLIANFVPPTRAAADVFERMARGQVVTEAEIIDTLALLKAALGLPALPR